jgi:hypothetical protein
MLRISEKRKVRRVKVVQIFNFLIANLTYKKVCTKGNKPSAKLE